MQNAHSAMMKITIAQPIMTAPPLTASLRGFRQALPLRIHRRSVRSGFQSQADACTRGNRYSFGEMWRAGIAQMLRYGLMSCHVLRLLTEHVRPYLMTRNASYALYVEHTTRRNTGPRVKSRVLDAEFTCERNYAPRLLCCLFDNVDHAHNVGMTYLHCQHLCRCILRRLCLQA